MIRHFGFVRGLASVSMFGLALAGTAQQEKHGRGYKPPPPTAVVTVVVEKGFNGKPLPNASVIFRSTRDGKLDANLETKTDPDGRASLDLLSVGSHITIQVIANGFATYATDFDLTDTGREVQVKLLRPGAQVSQYGGDSSAPAASSPGVQEHAVPKAGEATSAPPPPPSPTTPMQTTPPINSPATVPAGAPPAAPGTPQ